jgi:hypothetical protein
MESGEGMSSGGVPRFTVEVPAFREGGLVQNDGLAVVHKGEVVVPAEDAQADVRPVELGSDADMHLDFGIEVVVMGGIPEQEKRALEARVWNALDSALG